VSDSVRPHRWQPTRLRCPWDSPSKNTGVGCHFLLQCMKVKSEREVAQSCLTLSDPMDYSPPWDFPGKSARVGCHCLLQLVTQSCPTLSDPMDYTLPGSSVHGILQARILGWVAISFCRGSSWPRDQNWVSCLSGRFFPVWATWEAPWYYNNLKQNKQDQSLLLELQLRSLDLTL